MPFQNGNPLKFSLVLETNFIRKGQFPANREAGTSLSLRCRVWQKRSCIILVQLPLNISIETRTLLSDYFKPTALNSQGVLVLDHLNLWHELMAYQALEIEQRSEDNLHARPNLFRFLGPWRFRVPPLERLSPSFVGTSVKVRFLNWYDTFQQLKCQHYKQIF